MADYSSYMLVMKNVSKTFNPGTVNEKCALKNLDLTLKRGDFATIVGSNGAGNSGTGAHRAETGMGGCGTGRTAPAGQTPAVQKPPVQSK